MVSGEVGISPLSFLHSPPCFCGAVGGVPARLPHVCLTCRDVARRVAKSSLSSLSCSRLSVMKPDQLSTILVSRGPWRIWTCRGRGRSRAGAGVRNQVADRRGWNPSSHLPKTPPHPPPHIPTFLSPMKPHTLHPSPH